MNKKYIIIGVTCFMLLIAGILYFIAFGGNGPGSSFTTSLSGGMGITPSPMEESTPNPTEGIINQGITPIPVQADGSQWIYVHICGAVVKPGVFQIEDDARLCDLIALAEGLTGEAAGDYINQAQTLLDGQRIYIPTLEEIEGLTVSQLMEGQEVIKNPASTSDTTGKGDRLININRAGAEELMTLPGIGQAKAESIISYRNSKGEFTTIEELKNITGIKEGVFNRISSYITVE